MRKSVCTLISVLCLLSTVIMDARSNSVSDIFDRYSWLSGIVDRNNCGDAVISEYQKGSVRLLFIRQSGMGKLYFSDGRLICQNTPTYDCVSAYELNLGNRLIDTWRCNSPSQCTNEGRIFFQNCGGRTYYLLQTSDGRIYDPYLANGVSYTPVNGQNIKYSFKFINRYTPCTNVERAVQLTCVQVIETSNNLTNVGCQDLQAFDTRGNLLDTKGMLISSAIPGEAFELSIGRAIYILTAGTDTLALNSDKNIDSGGCEDKENSPQIFEEYT